ncbi:MAG TPA: sporulation protein YabP [Candidatus Anaerostipes avistercoris]|uniref:Sporulation protein YabP n=1 Tax=Candidatus Anaerostipes avistercoris TaxID=2838462 RepID=A0A9D2T8F0_9FIRM|nr:sporulation protein YabP [uncultured Anaerostipes sp.]HJC50292.1 sporulation protein YabP [Candidatus Anaerostipes avistercoris]
MIEDRQPVKAHKVSLLNRSLGVITGVRDVVSFDLNEIILDTEQGLLMIKGVNLHVKKLLVEKGEVEIDGKVESFLYSNVDESSNRREGILGRLFK